jgi:WD40 repeat protein
MLDGHSMRVNCFLYPFDKDVRYDPNILLSGGADFSVILWNVALGERIHRFSCQGGPITRMLVPPSNSSVNIA